VKFVDRTSREEDVTCVYLVFAARRYA